MNNIILKKIISLIFVLFLFVGFIRNGSYIQIYRLAEYLRQDINSTSTEGALTVDTIESTYTQEMSFPTKMIDMNGTMAKLLNMHNFYSNMNMYITDDLYIMSPSPFTTTDYEYEQIMDFKNFLDSNNINLLYVNEPTKYDDDKIFRDKFGIETYSNRNMDTFLERIRKSGVNTIDLRDNIKAENINISDLFYRTDHHWTTQAALWATKIIADGLNRYCDYNIDISLYDEKNYIFKHYSNCWLGEQGRKMSKAYVGLDDYTEIKPAFPTSYIFKTSNGDCEGTFDYFINESVYNLEKDVYKNASWHYSYSQINCINNNVDYGKVLILGDSYEQVTEPFISLGVHEVDSLILRNYDNSFDLRNYIVQNGYDTVIICYAQFMLGAHDNPDSANYRMFTFH